MTTKQTVKAIGAILRAAGFKYDRRATIKVHSAGTIYESISVYIPDVDERQRLPLAAFNALRKISRFECRGILGTYWFKVK